jgi:hypothetical protein
MQSRDTGPFLLMFVSRFWLSSSFGISRMVPPRRPQFALDRADFMSLGASFLFVGDQFVLSMPIFIFSRGISTPPVILLLDCVDFPYSAALVLSSFSA